jgi:hypothetical protein
MLIRTSTGRQFDERNRIFRGERPMTAILMHTFVQSFSFGSSRSDLVLDALSQR